ncbi:MAG TPA: zf-HC2 domain-containing protein [Actinomycetota bacterium]|nr:zf-HC2 domain-containing protein [Actinomycetota bacterium]
MTCDDVREQLAEHLLGTLKPELDAEVRVHLRGCAACRSDLSALAEGVNTLAAAAHDIEPPDELRGRVLAVLEEEWAAAAPLVGARSSRRWVARVATAAALVAAVAWGAVATVQALRLGDEASKYEEFLAVLGGENVRVGELLPADSHQIDGSVVIYDSKVGQSWVLVLVRAPGWEGSANVTMLAGEETRIDLRPIEFGGGGEASTWLVTGSDLTEFERVNLWNDDGLIASAEVERA